MLKMKSAGEIGARQKNRHGIGKKEVRTFSFKHEKKLHYKIKKRLEGRQ